MVLIIAVSQALMIDHATDWKDERPDTATIGGKLAT